MLMWDDDPDVGAPRMIAYTVVHVTGPGSISLVGDMRQRMHPTDANRNHGHAAKETGPRTECATIGCRNKADQRHRTCSGCRRRTTCACGRVRSSAATRCSYCVTAERRQKKARLWESRA